MKQLINKSIKHIVTLALTLLSTIAFTYLTYANAIYVEGTGWIILAEDDSDSEDRPATTAFITAGNNTDTSITSSDAPVILGDDAPTLPVVLGSEIIQPAFIASVGSPAQTPLPGALTLPAGAPVPEGYINTERGVFRVTGQFTAHATAYSPEQTNLSQFTATGIRFVTGIVAVDPTVIPLGTYIYVPDFGVFLAADTGSAIRGNRIDISFDTVREALQFGRREVPVYVLEKFTYLF